MALSQKLTIFIFTVLAFFILFFLDFENNFLYAVLFSSIIIYIAVNGIINTYKTIYIALLGYGVMIFLDIVSFHFIDPRNINTDSLQMAIFLSYISFLIFFIFYNLPLKPFNIKSETNAIFSKSKFDLIITPISTVFLIIFTTLSYLYPNDAQNPLFLLVSFLPKATLIIFFVLYLENRQKKYLVLFFIFLLFSFTESSRRIYLTLFFLLVSILIGYNQSKQKELSNKVKVVILFSSVIFFIFLNYLRADHDYGKGFKKDSSMENTLEYITSLKSIDTYYNTAYIIENFPKKYDYYYGETYISVLFMFVPRTIWPEKPISFSAPLGVLQLTGNRNFSLKEWHDLNMFSLSPGFIGEAHANFGILGVLILSALFGIFSKKTDLRLQPSMIFSDYAALPHFAWFSAFFLLLRGDFFTAVYYSIFYFIYLKLILIYCRKYV